MDKDKEIYESLHKKGNTFFSTGEYQKAIEVYNKCLEINKNDASIHGNKSLCNFKMFKYNEALKDILKAIEADPTAHKFHFRKANIYSMLGNHLNSITTLESQIAKVPKESEEFKEFSRLLEQEKELVCNINGKFNFTYLFKHINSPDVPAESYIGPIRVEYSESFGRGLFAVKDIAKGELVSASKSYAFYKWNLDIKDVPRAQRINAAHDCMTKHILAKISADPNEAHRVALLFDGKNAPHNVSIEMLNRHYQFATEINNSPMTNERVRSIVKHNSYTVQYWCTDTTYMKQANIKDGHPFWSTEFGSGLWLLDSFYNHSCDPNVISMYIGDMKFVRAIKDIKAGDQLFLQYLDINESYSKRQKALKIGYGFDCKCPRCAVQGSFDADMKALIKKTWRFTFKFSQPDNIESKVSDGELDKMFKLFTDLKAKGNPPNYAVTGKFKMALIKGAMFYDQSMNYSGSLGLFERIKEWVDDIHLIYGITEQIFMVTKQLYGLKSQLTKARIEDMKKIHMMLYGDEPTFYAKYQKYIYELPE